MVENIISILRSFFVNTNFAFIFILIYIIGLFIFWRVSVDTHKNRSSVFDLFILSGFSGLFLSRILYIIIEWERFSSFIWYWLPYEKYGDNIYLFRLLPWRFINIADGGLIILGLFLGLIFFATFYSLVIKKWGWKDMFFQIYISGVSMLSMSLLFTGFVSDVSGWFSKGLILLIFVSLFLVIFFFSRKIFKNPIRAKYQFGYIGLLITWISTLYIGYIYLSSEISVIEQLLVGLFLLWSFVMGIIYIIDLRKPEVRIESISSVRSITDK
jgi:hypothetical protein